MPVMVALLRAVNVGGTGMLPMKDLALLCADLGFQKVRTYIQSGNVVFECFENDVQAKLESALEARMRKRIDVFVRSAPELRQIVATNPFPYAQPSRVAVVFLQGMVPKDLVQSITSPSGEEVRAGQREIYIYYPDGMGQSKLKVPPLQGGSTVRNMNTVTRLAEMATASESASTRPSG